MAIQVIPNNPQYVSAVKNFWRKMCGMGRSINPALNNNGQKDMAAHDPSDEFFYLCFDKDEQPQVRVCNVPQGKGLFIPIVAVLVSDKEKQNASEKVLDTLTTTDEGNSHDLFVELDGIPQNPPGFKVHTDAFDVNYPNDPIWDGISQGRSMAVAGGHYLLTTPLTPGDHAVHFGGRVGPIPNGVDCIQRNYVEDITYRLKVQ